MANEINITEMVNVNNGSFAYSLTKSYNVTQNALGASGECVSVATTAQTISQTGVTTSGWATFTNCDPTNYVTIGSSVGGTYYPLIKLNAGESAVLRLVPGLTVQAQADTAAVMLQYMVLND